MIAVFLGWAFLRESVTVHMLWGAFVILVGVIIITVPQSLLMVLFNREIKPAVASNPIAAPAPEP